MNRRGTHTRAHELNLRGGQEDRDDAAAATVLRWLIGDDEHVPVRDRNWGELVGGFGDVVRSPRQMAGLLAATAEGQQQAAVLSRDLSSGPDDRRFARQDADYLDSAGNAAVDPR